MSVVYALEASDIAEHAKAVISSNGMAEQIEVIHCRVEVNYVFIIIVPFSMN